MEFCMDFSMDFSVSFNQFWHQASLFHLSRKQILGSWNFFMFDPMKLLILLYFELLHNASSFLFLKLLEYHYHHRNHNDCKYYLLVCLNFSFISWIDSVQNCWNACKKLVNQYLQFSYLNENFHWQIFQFMMIFFLCQQVIVSIYREPGLSLSYPNFWIYLDCGTKKEILTRIKTKKDYQEKLLQRTYFHSQFHLLLNQWLNQEY